MEIAGINFSIIDGWFPWFVLLGSIVTIVLSVHRHHGHWKQQLGLAFPISFVVVILLWASDKIFNIVGYAYPLTFFFWIWLAVFALCLCILGWKHHHWVFRIISVLAILFSAVLAGVQINKNYDYYPSFTSLFGVAAANESSLPALKTIQDHVRKTGVLPSHGVTVEVTPPPTASKFQADPTFVYLPPVWFANPQQKLPVIELFPGIPGSSHDWINSINADVVTNDFAAKHEGKAPILVMPDINGTNNLDTECSDTKVSGNAQTYLTKDVPNYIVKEFNTQANVGAVLNGVTIPSGWATAGLSEGGTCAAMLALRYPDEYRFFADYSGDASPVYGDGDPATPGVDQATIAQLYAGSKQAFYSNDPLTLLQGRFIGMGAWFAVGLQDGAEYQNGVKELHNLAIQPSARMGSVCLDLFDGAHNFAFWKQAYIDSLPWMAWRLGLTGVPATLPASASCVPPLH